jgi:hypothetical protein
VWYVVKCGSKNGHQKDTCYQKKFGLHAQSSTTNTIFFLLGGDLYDQLMSMRIFIFGDEENIHTNSENYETKGYVHDLEFLINLTLIDLKLE